MRLDTCIVHSNNQVIPFLFFTLLFIRPYIIYMRLHELYMHVHAIFRPLYVPNIYTPAIILHANCERVALLDS